jgi:hypothetical protein
VPISDLSAPTLDLPALIPDVLEAGQDVSCSASDESSFSSIEDGDDKPEYFSTFLWETTGLDTTKALDSDLKAMGDPAPAQGAPDNLGEPVYGVTGCARVFRSR